MARVPRCAPPAKTGIKYIFADTPDMVGGGGCVAKTDNIETTKKETTLPAGTFTNHVDNADPYGVVHCWR